MVYLLTGSEDGVMGVYSAKNRAIKAAIQYVAAGNEIKEEEVQVEKYHGFLQFYANDGHWATASVDFHEVQ